MKKLFLLLAIADVLWLTAQPDSTAITSILEEIDRLESDFEPDSSFNWKSGYFFLLVDQKEKRAKELSVVINKLEKIDERDLSRQDQINKSILLLKLKNEVSEVTFREYLLPFNAEGGFYNEGTYSLRNRSFIKASDYDDYLLCLKAYNRYLKYNLELLKSGIDQNVMRPEVIVKNTISLLQPWVGPIGSHPFYQPFLDMSKALTNDETTAIQQKGKELLLKEVIPTYSRILDFFTNTYLPASPKTEGIANIKNGNAYYEDRVRFFTTLEITPDSVYSLGQSEVNRIRARMEGIISELNFDGNFSEFINFLRTDAQFYAGSPEELLSRAAWLSKKAEGQLPRLFGELYELPFTVEPVPDAIAPTYTGGRYVPGSRRGNRAGIYWVNTYDLSSRPFYTLPALTLHEAVPGHHLQIMMSAELTDIPVFRNNYYISAYGEGWGLYSEYLGEEMGMYETPYDLFGRYTYEMWRACRLVVDVGLHYKGWTRQQAVDFLASNTALSLHEVNTEIDRYIGWPGQALSYKMGEITIKTLREKAESKLGGDFDIQEFHQCILENGSVPLTVLKDEVEAYILRAQRD
ncbi:MAG: DUF885 domain-containing protein [Marinoscillum sp.]